MMAAPAHESGSKSKGGKKELTSVSIEKLDDGSWTCSKNYMGGKDMMQYENEKSSHKNFSELISYLRKMNYE